MRARLVLVVLIASEAVALAVVATRVPVPAPVDWADPWGWLRRTDPETATLVVGRLVALAVAGWLLATTVLAVIVRTVAAVPRLPHRLRRATRHATRLAPAALRHVVEAAFAVGVGTAFVAPVGAATVAPRERPVAVARPLVLPLAPVRTGRSTVPTAPAVRSPAPTTARPAPPPPTGGLPTVPASPVGTLGTVTTAPTASSSWGRHRVVAGEHLWGIAEATVRGAGIDDPATVDHYWRRLCDANRDRLGSGDPNLIEPDEDVDLPPVA